MKRRITLKKGDALSIKLDALTVTEPRLREMVLTLNVTEDGDVVIGTEFIKSLIERAEIKEGYAIITPAFR